MADDRDYADDVPEEEEEEEYEDIKPELDEKCKETECKSLVKAYEACAERVEEDPSKQCTGQFLEMMSCVQACVAPKLWKTLK